MISTNAFSNKRETANMSTTTTILQSWLPVAFWRLCLYCSYVMYQQKRVKILTVLLLIKIHLAFGVRKPNYIFFGVGYATIFSHTFAANEAQASKRLNQRNCMSNQKHAPPRVIKTLMLLLLLSGDVHLNPGPLRKFDVPQHILEQQYQANDLLPGVNVTTNVLSLTKKNVGEMGHHVSQVEAAVDVIFPVAESVGASGHLGASVSGMDGAVAGAAMLGP